MEVQANVLSDGTRARRIFEATAFVGLWIGVGEILHVGSIPSGVNFYLLLGIPLVAAFQLLVRRRRIQELWVRDGSPITRRVATRVITVLLAVFPVYMVVSALAGSQTLAYGIYGVAAIGGACAAGYAYGHFTNPTWRYLALCLATGGVVGIAIDIGTNLPTLALAAASPGRDALTVVTSMLAYVPAMFVIEEVAFRGAVDSHVHNPGDGYGVLSAIYVSALWGVWHAPMFGWDLIVTLLAYQIAVGVFLSIFWRKSGNLGVSGATHAVTDTVRNVVAGGPPL